MRPALTLLAICLLSSTARADNIYPIRIINGTTTSEVDELQFSASDITFSTTNIPGAGVRGVVAIIGGGGGGGGSSNNTMLVAGNGFQIIDLGGGSNGLAVDPSVAVTNGGFAITVAGMTYYVANGGSITIPTSSGGGISNVLDSAGGPISLIGNTNQPTLLIKGITNQTPATLTITDFGTMLGYATAANATVVSNIFQGFAVTLASAGTISLDGTKVGLVGSNNTWAANRTNTFNGAIYANGLTVVSNNFTATGTGSFGHFSASQIDSGTLSLANLAWLDSGAVISNSASINGDAVITGAATISGNVAVGGGISAATLSGTLAGANVTGNGSLGTNLLAATGATAGTYGSSSQIPVVTLNSAGQVTSVGQAAIAGVGVATNAIGTVISGNSTNQNITTLSLAGNFNVTYNGQTAIVSAVGMTTSAVWVTVATVADFIPLSTTTVGVVSAPLYGSLNAGWPQAGIGRMTTTNTQSGGLYYFELRIPPAVYGWGSGTNMLIQTLPTSGSVSNLFNLTLYLPDNSTFTTNNVLSGINSNVSSILISNAPSWQSNGYGSNTWRGVIEPQTGWGYSNLLVRVQFNLQVPK